MGGEVVKFSTYPIQITREKLHGLESKIEDLKFDKRILEAENGELEGILDKANNALVEMWAHVPKDKRARLIDENEYIGEMFWDER